MDKEPEINKHNKEEYPPMHTAEHLLNGLMARRYGCGRAFSAHIERKKSKLDFHLPQALSQDEITRLEDDINDMISTDVLVTQQYITQSEAMSRFDLSRLPDNATDTVRVISIGEYDECLCAGSHVEHTAQIGRFRISCTRYHEGVQRIVFRLEGTE